jgi:hypothetical protein
MYISIIRSLITNEKEGELNTDDFMQMHKAVESYLKRLLLIALRRKGISYKNCQEVIKSSFLANDKLFNKVIVLLDELKSSETYKNDTLNVNILFDLFKNFSSVFRNKVVHGVITEINDKEVLKYCILINKNLIIKIEESLSSVYENKALEELKNWKFERNQANENISVENIIRKYNLGGLTKKAKSKTSVRDNLKLIGIIK